MNLLDKTTLSRSELGAAVAQNEAWHTKAANHQYAWKRNVQGTPCKPEADCGYCQQNNANKKTALKQEESKMSKKEKENRGTRSDSIKRSYSNNSALSSEAKRSHSEDTGRGTYTRIYTPALFPAANVTGNYRIPKKQVHSPLLTDQDSDQVGQTGLSESGVKDLISPDGEDKYKQGKLVSDNRDSQDDPENQNKINQPPSIQHIYSQNIATTEATHSFTASTAHLGSIVTMSILVEHRSLTDPGTTRFQVYPMEQVGRGGVTLEEFLLRHKKQ